MPARELHDLHGMNGFGPRSPLDTLVDAEPPVSIGNVSEAGPVTERAAPPDPRDYPRSETKIALFGLTPRPER